MSSSCSLDILSVRVSFGELLVCFFIVLYFSSLPVCVCVTVIQRSSVVCLPCLLCSISFTADDAKDLSALCSHISVALENIKRADEADEVRPLSCGLVVNGEY